MLGMSQFENNNCLDKALSSRGALLHDLQDRQFILLSLTAPRGYGKTTLLQFLSNEKNYFYIRLSDTDPDPLSITRLIHESLPELDDDKLAYEFTRTNLTSRAAGAALRRNLALQAPLTLMFDDLDTLEPEGRRFLLESILSQLPNGIRVILARTVEANLPIRSLVPKLQHRTKNFEERDLELSPSAMMQFFQLSPQQITLTKGWPAAVELAALGLDPSSAVTELLANITEDLRASLRRASLLPTWRSDDATHLKLGLKDGWLTEARQYGLPLTRLDQHSFEPHPLLRDALREDLQSRPQEFLNANNALGETLQEGQPLSAIEAYLRAENPFQASQVLQQALPEIARSEQLQVALDQLAQLADTPADPLYLAYAQAMFEVGDLTGGLLAAQRVLQTGARNVAAHSTLGRMRLRTGNLQEAAHHLRSALALTYDVHDAVHLRAQLALALATTTTRGESQSNLQAEQEALMVLAQEQNDASLQAAGLTARTALALGLAARGLRTEARAHAHLALGIVQGSSPTLDVVRCITLLSGFFADDDQPEIAEEMLRLAQTLDVQRGDAALMVALASARLALRAADMDTCARAALHAASLAAEQHNVPYEFEARLIAAISSLFPNGADPTNLDTLRERFASDADVGTLVHTMHEGLRGLLRLAGKGGNLSNLPPEIYALQTVLLYKAEPSAMRETELAALRERLGQGVLRGYGVLCEVDLPPQITPPRFDLEIKVLRAIPEVYLNGEYLPLSSTLLLLLILAAYRGPIRPADAQEIFGAMTLPGRIINLIYRIKKELEPITFKNAFGKRGELDLSAFRVKFDFDALKAVPFGELADIYRVEPFSAAGPDLCGPLLKELRQEARQVVRLRLQDLARVDPVAAEEVQRLLAKQDSALFKGAPGSRPL